MPKQPKHWQNFIAGQWCDAERSIEVFNPATGEVFASVACASLEDVNKAMSAARECVNSGELTRCRPTERAALLRRIANEIRALQQQGAELLVLENGKSLADANEEFAVAAGYFDYYAGMADKIEGKSIPLGENYVDFTYYEPMGVSVQIVPWNFPVDVCARSLAPALAAGCAVVVKSPENTPLAMTLLAQACERAGLPTGALSLLCGYGNETGAALVVHPEVDQIVFTGSVATGRYILREAAQQATPCVMELGGKSAAVVFADADIDELIESVRWGIFFNAGQVCSAMSRMLVQREIYEAVVARVTEFAESMAFDDSFTAVISAEQKARVLAMCDRAQEDGARLMTGGKSQDRQGYFVAPTVFSDVSSSSELFREEVFGPVLAMTPFDTEEEAWALANATDYGLVAGVFTRDLGRAMRASRALSAGQVFVNEWYAGGIETPFGGVGLSGFGREKGQEALYSYVRTKNVAIRVSNN